MRVFLVGVAAVLVAVAVPAFGGGIDDTGRRPGPAVAADPVEPPHVVQERAVIHETPPFGDVVVEEYHSAGAELGMGVASTILSVFYTPVRLVVGVAGAAVGGAEGWLTGGDLRTARSMWRPTVEGDYFIRPDHLDHTERYEFSNVKPVVNERYTVRGRQPMNMEETAAVAPSEVEVGSGNVAEPVEPELEDDADDR